MSMTTLKIMGERGVALCYPMESIKRGSMMSSALFYHGNLYLVRLEEPDFLESHVVSCQDVKAPVPVQGVVCIL